MADFMRVVVQDLALMQAISLKNVFNSDQGYLLAFCPFEPSDFFGYCAKYESCVAIIDLDSAKGDNAIGELIRAHKSVRLLVRRDQLVEREVEALVKMGCWGVIERHCDPASLKKAVDAISGGEMWVGRKLLCKLFQQLAFSEEAKLSPRELDVLKLLAYESTNNSMAEALFISPETLRWHLRNLYAKTGIRDRRNIIAYAKELVGDGDSRHRPERLSSRASSLPGMAPGTPRVGLLNLAANQAVRLKESVI
jgi:DNA-binding NarL/FixJ family response regulator